MSVNDFIDRPHISVDEPTWDKYAEYTMVDYEDKQYDDKKYNWKMVYLSSNDEKYGRIMISEKYKLRRGLTMGEFYGSGLVD